MKEYNTMKTCQGAAVTGMAIVMKLRGDPSASVPFLLLTSMGMAPQIA